MYPSEAERGTGESPKGTCEIALDEFLGLEEVLVRAGDVAARQRDPPPVVVLPHEVLARRQEVPVRLQSMQIQSTLTAIVYEAAVKYADLIY